MNKTFKTIWNEARRSYIVTNEAQKTHGKPSKSAVALAVAATAVLTMGAANAAYVEPGYEATASFNVGAAVASWETDEYKADWGLGAMHASKAYALGFTGKGVAVGVMDSGALLQAHPDLAGDRFHASEADSHYGSTGDRYPQDTKNPGHYDPEHPATESGKIDGNWIAGTNDSHGTHVTGSVGANRDGSEFHGVAFDSTVWVGNTGGTDSTNYGPFQDHDFFKNAWSALAQNLIKANGADRGGVINNSFGTNTRIVDTKTKGPDGGSTGVHNPTDTIADVEYEYFLFNNRYVTNKNEEGQLVPNWKESFVDAAWEAVEGTKVVQVMTTGNRDFANPFYRPLYPYFNPAAEKNWIAVAGLQKDGEGYKLVATWNEAGLGKYWTVVAPGSGIYGSKVDTATGNPLWGNSSGTSMSAPHVTGAMTVLMSRYEDMDATQVRDVMFTTANHYNPDGSVFGDSNGNGVEDEGEDMWTAKDGEVDVRYGWGVPDLDKGMYGLGQLLGTFDYKLDGFDVWTNDISEVALNQREREETAWLKDAKAWKEAYTAYQKNGNKLEGLTKDQIATLTKDMHLSGEGDKAVVDTDNDIVGIDEKGEKIALSDAFAWRDAYYQNRIDMIEGKLANDGAGYDGSLVKSGKGTLVLTGSNTYEGTTTVKEGTLLAFSESIGGKNVVEVEGTGTFGVLSSYSDNFTMTGNHTSQATKDDLLTINIADGGSLFVDAASNVQVKEINFAGAKKITVGLVGADTEQLAKVYKGEAEFSGSITAENAAFADQTKAGVEITDSTLTTNSAFFEVNSKKSEVSTDGKTLSVVAESNGKKIGDFATTANGVAIATALDNGPANDFLGTVLTMNKDQVTEALDLLSDDTYNAARNAFAVNSLTVSRTVIEQARSYGEGRAAEFENGRGRIWAAGVGQWMKADGASSSMDVDFGAGFVGAEWIATENTKVGAYFGYGTTKYEGSFGKIDGDDLHYGIYGMSDIGPVGLTYGVGYTTEDRDSIRTFAGTPNVHSEDATALQVFAEAAYNDFYLGNVNIAPYFGYEWMRIETDGFTETAMGHDFRMGDVEDDLQVATIGARVTAPVMVGKMPVAFKADVGYSRFFGDTESVTSMQLGNGGAIASIEGEELEGQVNFGLGVTAQIGKRATVGISYTGAYGSDTDTHGIGAGLRVNF